jgi:hypothetical protein
VLCGNTLRSAGLGRLTRQYNPDAPRPDEWLIHRARETAGAKIHRAEQLIGAYRMYSEVLKRRPTDTDSRRKFYQTEAELRKLNPASGAQSLGAWVSAVLSMKGESDAMPVAAAVDLIRTTPPEQRSQYAREIWVRRRKHHGRTGRSDSVPF